MQVGIFKCLKNIEKCFVISRTKNQNWIEFGMRFLVGNSTVLGGLTPVPKGKFFWVSTQVFKL